MRRCTKTDAFCALLVPASVDFVDKICAFIGHSAVQSWKTTKKANEPLQEAVSFVVKRRAFCERILRRSHIAAQKILAHIAQYASVLRRRGKYCRAHIYFRAHLTFNAVRPPVFLSFYPCKKVRLLICLRFSVLRLHFYPRLSAFLIMRLHAHSFSRIISLLFPSLFPGAFLFSPISKRTLNYFYAFFVRALFAYGSAGSIFCKISWKTVRFFVWIRPGTLVLCSFIGFSAFLPCANGKISSKILKKAFFRPFWAVLRGIKTPEKVLKKAWKTIGARQ